MDFKSPLETLPLITAGVSLTSTTASYLITAALPGNQDPRSVLVNGVEYAYYAQYQDGVTTGYEAGYGVWSGGNTLSRTVVVSHQSNALVNWGTAAPKIIKIVKGRRQITDAMFAMAHKPLGEAILAFATGQSEMNGGYPLSASFVTANTRVNGWQRIGVETDNTTTAGYAIRQLDPWGAACSFLPVSSNIHSPSVNITVQVGIPQNGTGNIAWGFADAIQRIFDRDVYLLCFATPGVTIAEWETQWSGTLIGAVLKKILLHWPAFLAAKPANCPALADFFLWSQVAGNISDMTPLAFAERWGFVHDRTLQSRYLNSSAFPAVIGPKTKTVLIDLPQTSGWPHYFNGLRVVQDLYPEVALASMEGFQTVDSAHQSGDNSIEIGRRAAIAGITPASGLRSSPAFRAQRAVTSLTSTVYQREADGSGAVGSARWRYHAASNTIKMSIYSAFLVDSYIPTKLNVNNIIRFWESVTEWVAFTVTSVVQEISGADNYATIGVVVKSTGSGGWPTVLTASTFSIVVDNLLYQIGVDPEDMAFVPGTVYDYCRNQVTMEPGYSGTAYNKLTEGPYYEAKDNLQLTQQAQVATKNTSARHALEFDYLGKLIPDSKREYHLKYKTQIVGAVTSPNHELAHLAISGNCLWAGRAVIAGYRSDVVGALYYVEYTFAGRRNGGTYTGTASKITGSEIDTSTGTAMDVTFTAAYDGAGNAFVVNGITGETWQWTVDLYFRELEAA